MARTSCFDAYQKLSAVTVAPLVERGSEITLLQFVGSLNSELGLGLGLGLG